MARQKTLKALEREAHELDMIIKELVRRSPPSVQKIFAEKKERKRNVTRAKASIMNVYLRYKKATNMSLREYTAWVNSPCSRKAGLNRAPVVRNLKLLAKPLRSWTQKDTKEANKTIAFIARMRKVKRGRIVPGCGMSKRDIALKNWAYNPRKK